MRARESEEEAGYGRAGSQWGGRSNKAGKETVKHRGGIADDGNISPGVICKGKENHGSCPGGGGDRKRPALKEADDPKGKSRKRSGSRHDGGAVGPGKKKGGRTDRGENPQRQGAERSSESTRLQEGGGPETARGEENQVFRIQKVGS